jgi:ribosomal protein S18 acetylase RimI-like enzyme
MKVDAKQAAYVSLVYRPKDCLFPGWWVSDFCLKVKYRRTHIEEQLIKQLDEILIGLKIPCIFASVYENALVEYMIYRNFGFKKVDIFIDNFLRYKNNKDARRIVMNRNTQRGDSRD